MFLEFLLTTVLVSPTLPTTSGTPFKDGKSCMPPTDQDISGYYTCKGLESGGKAYSGVAVISKKGEVYLIQWMVGGGSTFSGVAIRQGNIFSVSWALPGDRGLVRGVNLYKIEAGPRLVGRWATLPDGGILQNETLTFLKNIEEDD